MLFDIVEPRHPCNEKPSVVADIGLRLSEGIQELKLDQQLVTPTREAISRTFTAGAGGFFRAVEGVKGRFQQQLQRTPSSEGAEGLVSASGSVSSVSSTPVEVSPPLSAGSSADLGGSPTPKDRSSSSSSPTPAPTTGLGLLTSIKPRTSSISTSTSHRSTSVSSPSPSPSSFTRQHQSSVDLGAAALEAKATVGAWGAGIGSFLSTRASRFSMPRVGSGSVSGVSGVFGGYAKSSPADGGEQRVDEVRPSLPPASLSRPSRVEEEPDVGQNDGVRPSLPALPPPPPPRPQPSKFEEQPIVRSSPPPPPPRPQPSKIVEEPIKTASKFQKPIMVPAPASAIATAPPALPSRVKAAVAAVETRQPEPQIEREQEQEPHNDLDHMVMMDDAQPKTDTKTNSPTLPSSGLFGFAEHDHEHEHEGEENLHDVYGEASAVPGMAL
jgi:hypothetical protein